MKKNKPISTFYYKDGTKSFILYDPSKVLHRTDGPACDFAEDSYSEWWIDDEGYTEEEFNKLIEEVRQLPKVLRLIDPREWVRKL